MMPPRVLAIVDEVAADHGFTSAILLGGCRLGPICRARHELAWRLRNMEYGGGHPSLPQIGRWMNNRDHTTILYSVRRHEAALAKQAVAA